MIWWRAGRAAAAATALVAFLAAGVGGSRAEEHVVRLVTDGAEGRFRFEPQLVLAAVGDEVRFEPADRLHAVKSIGGMLPEGVAPWRGRMGEEVRLRVQAPGVYGVKCSAHYQIGMVALIVAGDAPPNWDAARAVRHAPMAAERMEGLFREAACRLGRPAEGCARTAAAGVPAAVAASVP